MQTQQRGGRVYGFLLHDSPLAVPSTPGEKNRERENEAVVPPPTWVDHRSPLCDNPKPKNRGTERLSKSEGVN